MVDVGITVDVVVKYEACKEGVFSIGLPNYAPYVDSYLANHISLKVGALDGNLCFVII